MSKYRITGAKIETISSSERKPRKSKRGIGFMVLGGAILATTLGGIVVVNNTFRETKDRIDELEKRLEQPVIESSLYLNQNYGEERAELSAMQEEYASLGKEKDDILLFETILPGSLALLGGVFFCSGFFRYQKQALKKDAEKESRKFRQL